ncbi:hypothetical protein DJ70_05040 [Halorubrum halodurans]|uniref:Uncharacterized protein n=1 Tax=Halorubrum halodurans TaxID=1383851 RepID=A0A256INN7_9EURY|nr:hypothetical protein DJ70_05040 [Halorubrum halodurans]
MTPAVRSVTGPGESPGIQTLTTSIRISEPRWWLVPSETERKVAYLAKKWRIPREEARRLLNIKRSEASDE